MTQENEMPREIWLIDTASDPLPNGMYCAFDEPVEGVRDLCSYIRRAVTKEEAGELDADLSKAVAEDSGSRYAEFVRKYYPLIRKMAEAHK